MRTIDDVIIDLKSGKQTSIYHYENKEFTFIKYREGKFILDTERPVLVEDITEGQARYLLKSRELESYNLTK